MLAARNSMHKRAAFYAGVRRAVIYARVSQDAAGFGRSVDRQIEYCKNVIDQHEDWELGPIIEDNDISASRYGTKDRPGYRQLLGELREGDVLVIWESSRASRKLSEFVVLRDLCENLGVLLCAGGQVLDLRNSNDRLQAGMRALYSEFESDQLAGRVLDGIASKARRGFPHTRPPYGYRVIRDEFGRASTRLSEDGREICWEQVPDEVAILRYVADRLLVREGWSAINRHLKERGVTTQDGGPTKYATWRARLLRPVYVGDLVHQGEVVARGAWEPVFDREIHEALVALLKNPDRVTHRGTAPKWLLSGIARCGGCGYPMSRHKSRGTSYYICRGQTVYRLPPPHATAPCDLVESVVLAYMSKILTDPKYMSEVSSRYEAPSAGNERAELLAEAKKKEEYLESYIELAADPDNGITPIALGKLEAKLRPEIKRLRESASTYIASLSMPSARLFASSSPLWAWERYDIEEKKETIRDLLEITVMPIGRGAPRGIDSIRVQWRQS